MKKPLFKDNFSEHAAIYAKFRPVYPAELFDYLGSLTAAHDLAWDCACGNGQCAIQLVNFYKKVFASDPSEEQLRHAMLHDRIVYKEERAEKSSLPENCVDLLVVAQALHWFDHQSFFEEASRVLKPGGIIAVISYMNPEAGPAVDALTDRLHDVVLKDYWKPENRMVEEKYRTIVLPFERIHPPVFEILKELSRSGFLGHLRTWSAVQKYVRENGIDPLVEFSDALDGVWDENEIRTVRWPLHLMIGRNKG